MKFSTYAEHLTPDHPRAKAGVRGELLQDILDRNGGRYEVHIDLPDKYRNDMRKIATLTSDAKLAKIADTEPILISLDHLRHLDPKKARIVFGARLDREPGDGALPGFDR